MLPGRAQSSRAMEAPEQARQKQASPGRDGCPCLSSVGAQAERCDGGGVFMCVPFPRACSSAGGCVISTLGDTLKALHYNIRFPLPALVNAAGVQIRVFEVIE
ncbi:hypothetical protein MRX96_058439 [Rhipicephalus microplus]